MAEMNPAERITDAGRTAGRVLADALARMQRSGEAAGEQVAENLARMQRNFNAISRKAAENLARQADPVSAGDSPIPSHQPGSFRPSQGI